ncbi:MAG: hypothetical protein ACJ8F4_07030 [Sphingomonas sp.]
MVLTLLALLAAQTNTPPSNAAKPKLVCREAEGHLGSHVRTSRRCLTAEQWQQEDAERARVPVTLRVTAGQGDTPTRPSQTPQ